MSHLNESYGQSSPPKALLFGTLGAFGLVSNFLAVLALPYCDLTYATLFLMRLQCGMNMIGLLCKGIVGSAATASGQFVPPLEWGSLAQVPGSLLVVALYSQFALQATMAINRYIAFCHHAAAVVWFDAWRIRLYSVLCVLYGLAHASVCQFFVDCLSVFDPRFHQWTYLGERADARKYLTIANDLIVMPTLVICYSLSYKKMRSMSNQITVAEFSDAERRRERRVLCQFMSIAGTWALYTLFYRSLYFFPQLRIALLSECLRFCMFTIDPIVYCIFMHRLRQHVLKIVTFGSYPKPTSVVRPTYTPKADRQRKESMPMHVMEQARNHEEIPGHSHIPGRPIQARPNVY